MNKKAVSGTLITAMILLIFAGIIIAIFFLPNSLLPEIAEQTKRFERFLPGRSKEDIPSGIGAPEEIKKIFDDLYDAFIKAKGKEDCYIKYTSLDIGEYIIELEYIEAEKGIHMRLINEKKQLISNHFVNGIQHCIALPNKKDDNIIVKVSPLNKAEIKNNNKLWYGSNPYDMFGKYPILYAAKGNDWACFFTDDTVIDPITGIKYGDSVLNDGFDDGDMEKRMKDICK